MRPMIAAIVGLTLATAAEAKTPLRDVPAIDDRMLSVALALEISEKCGEIDARTLKGLNYLWSLKRKANALGYSDDEINTYRKSPEEKARIRSKGETYVKSKGLNPNRAQDLCKLGHAEIAQGSLIGSLLKAK
ncbi:DUF5333 domain-containing protein [Marimonas arenosa]|uniref:DUF5333 domain-containing protein n=1 Tax=Marimonas arenosa TaxID=1795305 RepID=A0AAE3WF91_9RHOB|nr:DUF5333 domain-containing protein [Marimonas arenosa]MDQ2091448.1 DUF5333 domain-containing protein [Marimonas arenosa]